MDIHGIINRTQFGDIYPSIAEETTNDLSIPDDDSSRKDISSTNKSVSNNYSFSILGFFLLLIALLFVTNMS